MTGTNRPRVDVNRPAWKCFLLKRQKDCFSSSRSPLMRRRREPLCGPVGAMTNIGTLKRFRSARLFQVSSMFVRKFEASSPAQAAPT